MSKSELLLHAAASGQLALVKSLHKKKGVNINYQDEDDGSTALALAAMNGHETIVKHLLDNGANVNQRCKDGFTALMMAAQEGHETIVKRLIEKNAPINHQTERGATALLMACQAGHESIVEQLLLKGADTECQMGHGWTALMCAAMGGYKTIVTLLIAKGAKIDHQHWQGQTALMVAAEAGHLTTVEHLCNMGADRNLKMKNCQNQRLNNLTAAKLAEYAGQKNIVKYFNDCPMNPIEEFYKKLKNEGSPCAL